MELERVIQLSNTPWPVTGFLMIAEIRQMIGKINPKWEISLAGMIGETPHPVYSAEIMLAEGAIIEIVLIQFNGYGPVNGDFKKCDYVACGYALIAINQ